MCDIKGIKTGFTQFSVFLRFIFFAPAADISSGSSGFKRHIQFE